MNQNSSSKPGALCISDTLAIHAWCENHDEAAAHWLREKYTPTVTEWSADRLPHRPAIEKAVALTFERMLALLELDAALPPVCTLLSGVVHQVCTQLQIETAALAA